MCGRFDFLGDEAIPEIAAILRGIREKYGSEFSGELAGGLVGDFAGKLAFKPGEIRPTDTVPVLAAGNGRVGTDGRPELRLMRWGFPKWDGKGVVINAKSETAREKPMFAESTRLRRCVVPSTGFYEWARCAGGTRSAHGSRGREGGKAREKYRFNAPNTPMLYMAGIYKDFGEGGATDERFVILTCAANGYISDIHDRMPVILHKNELTKWLTDGAFADRVMKRGDIELLMTKV